MQGGRPSGLSGFGTAWASANRQNVLSGILGAMPDDEPCKTLPGTGAIVLAVGKRIPVDALRIEQTYTGRLIVRCQRTAQLALAVALGSPLALEGTTDQGEPFRTVDVRQWLDDSDELCFFPRCVEIGERSTGCKYDFELTNVDFRSDNPKSEALAVTWGTARMPVRLIPQPNYRDRMVHLIKTRSIAPTAVLRVRCADLAEDLVAQFASDVCHALSIMQGRKINWISQSTYGPQSTFEFALLGEAITKPFAVHALAYLPGERAAATPPLRSLEHVVPKVKRFREEFDGGNRLINSWLDARTEGDYLEARTLKYVVVVETLIALTCHIDKSISKIMRTPEEWKHCYEALSRALPDEFATMVTIQNWNRLNDRGFADKLQEVCKAHRIEMERQDLVTFKKIRNAIVHSFDYDSKVKLPNEWQVLDSPQTAQHFFVATFVDRIILQLFGLAAYLPDQRAKDTRASEPV